MSSVQRRVRSPMLNLENLRFGVPDPDGGSSSLADMLTRAGTLSVVRDDVSSRISESLAPP